MTAATAMEPDLRDRLARQIVLSCGYSFDQGHGRASSAALEIVGHHLDAMRDELDADERTRMTATVSETPSSAP